MTPAELADALRPLVYRVRTDVTAVKGVDGRQAWTREPLTKARLLAHVEGKLWRGVCPIKEGERTTRLALLDFDSHGGEVSWERMSEVVAGVVAVLGVMWGMECVLFRSSGGRGVHLFLLWDVAQDAYSVRAFLRGVLESCGLKSGTKGVAFNEVEIFPRQDSVAVGGFGNQLILPFAGKSVPLELTETEIKESEP